MSELDARLAMTSDLIRLTVRSVISTWLDRSEIAKDLILLITSCVIDDAEDRSDNESVLSLLIVGPVILVKQERSRPVFHACTHLKACVESRHGAKATD